MSELVREELGVEEATHSHADDDDDDDDDENDHNYYRCCRNF